jgi:pimeloyl-ACP methyl ester carboxylesterase
MANYVLIHGASSDSWYWHLVQPDLEARGHQVIAPDLPSDDDAAGLPEYANAVVKAVVKAAADEDLIVVAQSLGGFTVPLVCQQLRVKLVILVAAMVPSPGETPGQWWQNTGWEQARQAQARRDGRALDAGIDAISDFFHDVPPAVAEEAFARGERLQSGTPFQREFPMPPWPDVPTRFLLCRQDRFCPADFMRRVVRARLGITPDEIESGHVPALAHPKELAERLEAYRTDQAAS